MAGRGRRQLIVWDAELMLPAGNATFFHHRDQLASGEKDSFVTVTRHWSEQGYRHAARSAGLEPVLPLEDLLVDLDADDQGPDGDLLRYRRKPKSAEARPFHRDASVRFPSSYEVIREGPGVCLSAVSVNGQAHARAVCGAF